METKHTQGEWFVNPRSSRNVRCGSKTIANCSQGQNGENEEIANAKLIAAAPKMLEALELIINTCNPKDVTKHKQSHGMDLGEFYVGSCSTPSNKAIHIAIDALKKAKGE